MTNRWRELVQWSAVCAGLCVAAAVTWGAANGKKGADAVRKVDPVALYKGVDFKSFVRVAVIDPKAAARVTALLDDNGIPNLVEGSVSYGVSVPPALTAQAVALLKADAKDGAYRITFVEDPPRHMPELASRVKASGGDLHVSREDRDRWELSIDFPTRVGDDALEPLHDARGLAAIRILKGEVTDKGLSYLKNLPDLRTLVVDSKGFTDEGLRAVGGLKGLTKLDLQGARITAKGLDAIRGLPNLKELYLYGADIRDADAEPLKKFGQLGFLDLPPSVSIAAADAIQAALPKTRVRRHSGPADDQKKLDGAWVVESITRDPPEKTPNEGQGLRCVIGDGKVVAKLPGQGAPAGTLAIKLDPSATPAELDARPVGEKDTILAIYEVKGDTLKVCFPPAGKPRPKEFEAKAGTGQTLVVLKREKPKKEPSPNDGLPARPHWLDVEKAVRLADGDWLVYRYGSRRDSGVEVYRLDGTMTKQRWRAECKPLGVAHSRYYHRADVDVRNNEATVTSVANEGHGGQFVERLDLATGRMVAREVKELAKIEEPKREGGPVALANPPGILLAEGIDADGNLLLVEYRTIFIQPAGPGMGGGPRENERSVNKVSLKEVKVYGGDGKEVTVESARKRLGGKETPVLVTSNEKGFPPFYRSLFKDDVLLFAFPNKAPAWKTIQDPSRPVR